MEKKEVTHQKSLLLKGYAAVAASGAKPPKTYKSSLVLGEGLEHMGLEHQKPPDSVEPSIRSVSTPDHSSSDGLGNSRQGPLVPKEQICFDFTKGQCRRGEGCKFSHDVGYIIRVNSQEKGICFDFLKGTCRRGVLCRFSHDLNNLKPMIDRDQDQTGGKRDVIGTKIGAGKKKPPICYDFVKNNCIKGDNCRYSHDYTALYNQVHRKKPQPSEQANPNVPRQDCEGGSPNVCIDYLRGHCSRGMMCASTHVGRTPEENVPVNAGMVTVPVAQNTDTTPESLDDLIARLKKMQYEESIMKRNDGFQDNYSQYSGMSYPPPSMSQGARLMDAYYNAQHHAQIPMEQPRLQFESYGKVEMPMSPPVTHAEKMRLSLRSQLLQEQETTGSPMIGAGWSSPLDAHTRREYYPSSISDQQPLSPLQQSGGQDLHSFLTMQSIWSQDDV